MENKQEKIFNIIKFSSVQSLSHVRLFATPWPAACQASLSITNSRSPSKPMSTESGDAIQPSHPLLSPSPPALNLSQHQGLFKWVRSSHEVAKVLKKMQIKTTRNFLKLTVSSVDEDVEELELNCWSEVKWCNHSGKQPGSVFKKLNLHLPQQPSCPLLSVYPVGRKYLFTAALSGIIPN